MAPSSVLTPPLLRAQVLVLELSDVPSEHAVSVASVDILQDREGFTWKGHERLSPRTGPLPWPAGFQPRVLVQCLPPAAITAVTLHTEWNLVAFGTSHGFGLFDYQRKSSVLARCVDAGWGLVGCGLHLHWPRSPVGPLVFPHAHPDLSFPVNWRGEGGAPFRQPQP